jgi:hypothetical protein
MRTLAICAAGFEKSVRKAAGVQPLLSPPLLLATFQPQTLEGYDFIYFKLHGLANQPYWYGDHWGTAMSAEQISQADLSGAVVFVANCHLYEIDPVTRRPRPGPMLDALLSARAGAILGGPGENYGRLRGVHGADALGRTFRRCLGLHVSPQTAFKIAKARLRLNPRKDAATRDALQFRLFHRRYGHRM